MSILTFNNLSQSFGAFDLYSGISGRVPNDGKIGLVGPNGIGKSTLIRQLVGESKSPTGGVNPAADANLGYLRQEAMLAFRGREHFTVYEEMKRVFDHLQAQAARLREMEAAMTAGDDSAELLQKYSTAQEAFERAGGYDYDVRIQQVLDGLGFDADNWQTPLHNLSGGQKTRALLARLLLERPNLLVLDEPTNHLDVDAIEWLEGQLRIWDGAILIVSHDRYFLDTVVDTIWEMSSRELELYRGNYSAYVQQREERWERRRKELEAEQERLEKEMEYIRRNIAGQRTAQAKGKLRRLNAELGVDGKAFKLSRTEEKLKEFLNQRVAYQPQTFNLRLESGHRSGKIVLRTKNLEVGYPNASLFEADDLELTRLECAALIGPNGCGKTTFLKTVLEKYEPLAGEVDLGAGLSVGYFSQAHDSLDLDNSVLDELLRHEHMRTSEARSYLGQYLFSGEDVYKKVSALSGGERGRLALAILALQNANFLLLDEPTNHLDIPSQELLQQVLEQFEGTILMVSHDRYLIDRLATQIWAVRDGRLRCYKGNYKEYVAARDAALQAAASPPEPKPEPAVSNGRETNEELDEPVKLSKNEQRRLQQKITAVENEIETAEAELARLTAELQAASEAQDFDKIQRKSIEYQEAETHLEALMDRWAELAG